MAVAPPQQHGRPSNTPSQPAPNGLSVGDQEAGWDGDKMFNIYIWDYCSKRGYTNTARELIEEAKLEPNPRPPIDAKQGLLFEWWSVFWMLFSAKNNHQGSEDAMLYVQSRMQQGENARLQNGIHNFPGSRSGIPPNAMGVPNAAHIGAMNQLPQASMHRMVNGLGTQQPPVGAQSQQQQQQQPPPHHQPPLGFPGPQNQLNGVAPQPGGRGHNAPNQPPRGVAQGLHQSPTMAHPHTPTGANFPGVQPGTDTGPMGGTVPSNSFSQQPIRGMMPPNSIPNGVANAGSPAFSQGGAGSRAATPAQIVGQGQPNSITQPSPGMSHRPPPHTPPSFGGTSSGMPMQSTSARGLGFEQENAELQKIDPQTMNELRTELGLGNKDVLQLSVDEKNRLLHAHRARMASGTSQLSQNRQGRGSKRSSTSPGNQHSEVTTKSETSPPATKKARPSPEQIPSTVPTPGSQPGQSPMTGNMFPPNGPSGAMRGQQFASTSMMIQQGISPQMMQQNQPQRSGNLSSMNKMAPPDQHPQGFGQDSAQPRPLPSFTQGSQARQQPGKQTGMLPPPSPSTNMGKGPQSKVEGSTNSPRPPPSSSGSTAQGSGSPATSSINNQAAPSPSTNDNNSRPATASSNPPSSAPSNMAALTGPPAPASAPPGSGLPVELFMSSSMDDFTQLFGSNDGFDLGQDFNQWFVETDTMGGLMNNK